MTHSIGVYQFAIMQGIVPQARQTIEIIERPGVSGFVRRRNGIQSPPFQLVTFIDMVTVELARQEQHGYVALINDAPQVLIKDGFDYSTQGLGGATPQGFWVTVLDVNTVLEHKRNGIAGGLNNGDYALQAQWTLRTTPVLL